MVVPSGTVRGTGVVCEWASANSRVPGRRVVPPPPRPAGTRRSGCRRRGAENSVPAERACSLSRRRGRIDRSKTRSRSGRDRRRGPARGATCPAMAGSRAAQDRSVTGREHPSLVRTRAASRRRVALRTGLVGGRRAAWVRSRAKTSSPSPQTSSRSFHIVRAAMAAAGNCLHEARPSHAHVEDLTPMGVTPPRRARFASHAL